MAREWIVPEADIGCDGAYFGYEELTRCRDCKHYGPEWQDDASKVYECYRGLGWTGPDDYCSRGERKEGADGAVD